MNEIEFKKELLELQTKNLSKCKILEQDEINKLYEYFKGILEWNEKVNLTSIKDEKEFIVKHYLDSLTILRYIEGKYKILDVGTGAGFPGVPNAICSSKSQITLIDSIKKKLNVIDELSKKIKIENIRLIHTRAEDLAKDNKERESYDVVVSRAVANMTTLVEYLLPFAKLGGLVICMKGPNYEEELNQSKKAINLLGGEIHIIEKFILDNEMERNLIIIKKVSQTPKKYPRLQGLPLKKPLL